MFSKLKADADSQTKLVKSLDKKLRASEKERASVKTKYDEVASALLEKANEAEQLKRQVRIHLRHVVMMFRSGLNVLQCSMKRC